MPGPVHRASSHHVAAAALPAAHVDVPVLERSRGVAELVAWILEVVVPAARGPYPVGERHTLAEMLRELAQRVGGVLIEHEQPARPACQPDIAQLLAEPDVQHR